MFEAETEITFVLRKFGKVWVQLKTHFGTDWQDLIIAEMFVY